MINVFWQNLLVGFLLATIFISLTIAFFYSFFSTCTWLYSDIFARHLEIKKVRKLKDVPFYDEIEKHSKVIYLYPNTKNQ